MPNLKNEIKVSIDDDDDLTVEIDNSNNKKQDILPKKKENINVSLDDDNDLDINLKEEKDDSSQDYKDADFSTIDESIINSLIDNLGTPKEDE